MYSLKKDGHEKSRGKLIVRADSVKESNWEVHMKAAARDLPSHGCCCFTSNNLYFEIHRASPSNANQFFKVYKSDSI
jgi:hypothetical protein